MKCQNPKCNKTKKTKTTDSREKGAFRWRRNFCPSCGTRWTTYEFALTGKKVKEIPEELKTVLMPVFLRLCSEEVEKNVAAKLARLLNEMTLDENTQPSGV